MRKLLLVVMCLAVAGLVGCSQEAEAGQKHYKKYINSSDEVKPRVEAGIGGDIKLWDHKKFVVDQETKFDLNSGDGTWEKSNLSTYTVVKPKMDKGLFQIIGDKITSLIKRN